MKTYIIPQTVTIRYIAPAVLHAVSDEAPLEPGQLAPGRKGIVTSPKNEH